VIRFVLFRLFHPFVAERRVDVKGECEIERERERDEHLGRL